MHFYWPHLGGVALELPFNAWGWIFASLVMGAGLWRIARSRRLVLTPLQVCGWAGGVLLLLPMLYPGFEFKAYALPRLLGLFAGLLFLLSLYQWPSERAGRDKWLHLILGAVAIEGLLGFVQFYGLSPGNWLGYDALANRPYGVFHQANVMASFMATGLALALWLEMRPPALPGLQILRYTVIFMSSVLLVVLQSRVGQLGAVLAVLLLWPQAHLCPRRGRLLLLLALGVAVGLLSLFMGSGVKRGIEIYQSGGLRADYWLHALKLIAQSPWSGWGYGGFESTFLHHYMTDRLAHPGMPIIEENLDHPHNEFLYWAVEGGVVPMLGLLLMAGALVWPLRWLGWRERMALLSLVTPILLHTQTEFPFYHAIVLWWIFLILVWVLDQEGRDAVTAGTASDWREQDLQSHVWLRGLALVVPLLVVPFMLTGLHTAKLVTQFEKTGRTDVALLKEIINPVAWFSRVERTAQTLRLIAALESRDTVALEAYLAWARAHVRRTPRARIYANMVMVLELLGRKDQAQALQTAALVFYPENPGLRRARLIAAYGLAPGIPKALSP